ncbi:ubiquinone biosynthesis protein [Citromicrobium sp. RCC1885]|uniref:class I SAM-dependent methyltransferase n=1 Tax=unclassified Citromicrobium TaxID=2630544 RepID=UPI0006C8F997|nr:MULTISPECIES: class I SAM-dependent methyltransferase [unclassified Citromicrobium]KPM25537.1 ubiquinone biosynthesis protein [Citromicrobium sp. RCC1885]KPM28779.1 ubiquinone biosynthesis protein [Citromicrobium sp. RCC1878]MAO03508.1 class I SAM-dependent methyltransferase [Citromicrobium sp.]OAM09672.1 ubiquinone biosynthesis protein [Citromicrobium sp. RCC1897]|tara:strand:+ start:591 stop:1373 length:783 start_codon:yes stop_codon:yes gene_type:complete
MSRERRGDGSAGDVDYGAIGGTYSRYRQPDRVIEAQIHGALGDARTVLNVGAGAGSYEPTNCEVTAVEPSASMRAQRPAHLSRAIDAVAESLPFEDQSFDASMASVTVHQWSNLEAGLAEMRRVTRGPVVLLVCDPAAMMDYWLADYIPEVREIEASRFPSLERIAAALGGTVVVENVPVPLECRDGFNEAYYGRPEAFLDENARLACSSWSLVPGEAVRRFEAALSAELESGKWDEKYGHLRKQPFFDGPLRLVIGTAA